jgi:hypothetical protein
MISNKQRTIALSTVAIAAAIVLFASGPLVVQAQFDIDKNPTTGNPHPVTGGNNNDGLPFGTTETGNPHNSQSCNGNPHGEKGLDACHGSQ